MYLAESFPRVPKQSQASSMDTDPSPKAMTKMRIISERSSMTIVKEWRPLLATSEKSPRIEKAIR